MCHPEIPIDKQGPGVQQGKWTAEMQRRWHQQRQQKHLTPEEKEQMAKAAMNRPKEWEDPED